jgi:hypothetical protein
MTGGKLIQICSVVSEIFQKVYRKKQRDDNYPFEPRPGGRTMYQPLR